jgi:hypothetical protein
MVPSVLGERTDERILPKFGRWSRLEGASRRIVCRAELLFAAAATRVYSFHSRWRELAPCVRCTS